MVNCYLRASSNGDDTSQEISNHRFQGDRQAIYMDGVDQTQTVLFSQSGGTQRSRVKTRVCDIMFNMIKQQSRCVNGNVLTC